MDVCKVGHGGAHCAPRALEDDQAADRPPELFGPGQEILDIPDPRVEAHSLAGLGMKEHEVRQ